MRLHANSISTSYISSTSSERSCGWCHSSHEYLPPSSTGELCHRLGALAHGVLGQLARQYQAHCSLNLTAGQRGLLVHAAELRRLRSNLQWAVDGWRGIAGGWRAAVF